jgi:serine/threonine protein kinase
VLINEGYDGKKSDAWSCGVVLFAMLYGTVPFKGADMSELHTLIKQGKYNLKDDASLEARNLIKEILEVDP